MGMLSSLERIISEGNPDAVIITSSEDVIVHWSQGARQIFGFSSGEALGSALTSLIVPAEVQERERQMRSQVLQSGNSTYEGMRRKKDGTLVHVVVTSRLIAAPDGAASFIMSTCKDVTELKVQRDAKLIQARFGDLLESTPDAIIMANPTGLIVLANTQAESLFGYGSGELLAQPVDCLLPQRFRAGHVAHRSGYFAHSRTRSMGVGLELYGLRKDGTEFPVEISLSPLHTDGGMLVMSAIRDISERKRIERTLQEKNDELLRANQAKDRFLASMSHELRTPLNGIIGFAEFLVDGKPGAINAKQKEYLGDILSSGSHLLRLINDMLDLVKVQAGRVELNLSSFDLRDAISEVCTGVMPLAQNKHITVDVSISDKLPAVHLDLQRSKQILYNLLSNALKFTDEGGRVHVSAEPADPGMFRVAVQDTGIGIRQEDMHRLFSEFEQLDSGSARRFGGTGLGLALTRRITELQGGSVEVQSVFGLGSTFTVTLPLSAQERVA